MAAKFNSKLLMVALGIIQPASPKQVVEFLSRIYPAVKTWPDAKCLKEIYSLWIDDKQIICVNKKRNLYVLTKEGNRYLGKDLCRKRDKARISLLNECYRASIKKLDVVSQESGGDSPSVDARPITQEEGQRPISSAAITRGTSNNGRTYWPLITEQLNLRVGFDSRTSSASFRYGSFPNLHLLRNASFSDSQEKDITLTQLALCVGVTPWLISTFTHTTENHYRRFTIGKKGGGEREIASPRFFLKTVQYWLKVHFLYQLKVHDSCHAYINGKSIITNASLHLGKDFVANIDLENFFGRITQDQVFQLLEQHEFGSELAVTIARLVTFDSSLPQGAPTSPIISNAILFDFDVFITNRAEKMGLIYTRYADDITISGDSKTNIISLINECSKLLKKQGHSLKEEKSRIASFRASQRVTGLVVNEIVQPPRKYRRNMRAMFNQALKNPTGFVARLDEIRGHFSYLSSFESINKTRQFRLARVAIWKVDRQKKIQERVEQP